MHRDGGVQTRCEQLVWLLDTRVFLSRQGGIGSEDVVRGWGMEHQWPEAKLVRNPKPPPEQSEGTECAETQSDVQ